MATQKKATDPTEMALSAIEEALNLTSATGTTAQKPAPVPVSETPKPLDEPLLRGRTEPQTEPTPEKKAEKPVEKAADKPAPTVATPKAEMPRTETTRPVKESATYESAAAAPRIEDQGLPFTPPVPEKQKLEPGRPANDDRRAVGEILQSMKVRPVAWPTGAALAASGAWIVLILPFAYGQ